MQPITLILTTFNEEKTISKLLESILQQTITPNEIIIVDAKSHDNTPKIISDFQQKTKLPIKLITKKTNRSQGRNTAVSQAKNNIIAVTDAGCILGTHWLERITKPLLQQKADSVAGFYLTLTPTFLGKAIAPFVATMPDNFNPDTYLPSSRSIAFSKQAWEKVGKYPEHLNYCEDLDFAKRIKANTNMVVRPRAIVYWSQKQTYSSFFHQIRNYAKGDVEAVYYPHIFKIMTVFARYMVFLLIPFIFPIYLLWPIFKHRKHVHLPLCFIYLPALQVTADVAVMFGFTEGILNEIRYLLLTIFQRTPKTTIAS